MLYFKWFEHFLWSDLLQILIFAFAAVQLIDLEAVCTPSALQNYLSCLSKCCLPFCFLFIFFILISQVIELSMLRKHKCSEKTSVYLYFCCSSNFIQPEIQIYAKEVKECGRVKTEAKTLELCWNGPIRQDRYFSKFFSSPLA